MAGVRIATEADAAAIAAIYGPYVRDTIISFEAAPPSADEMLARMRKIAPRYPYLVFEHEGEVVAYAYAMAHGERAAYRWSVDVAIYSAPKAQRRGIGRALYARLFEILERQGFHRAYACISLPNESSIGLHEAMGFTPLGVFEEVGFKFGAWRAVGWWARPLRAGLPDGEPVAFADLR